MKFNSLPEFLENKGRCPSCKQKLDMQFSNAWRLNPSSRRPKENKYLNVGGQLDYLTGTIAPVDFSNESINLICRRHGNHNYRLVVNFDIKKFKILNLRIKNEELSIDVKDNYLTVSNNFTTKKGNVYLRKRCRGYWESILNEDCPIVNFTNKKTLLQKVRVMQLMK